MGSDGVTAAGVLSVGRSFSFRRCGWGVLRHGVTGADVCTSVELFIATAHPQTSVAVLSQKCLGTNCRCYCWPHENHLCVGTWACCGRRAPIDMHVSYGLGQWLASISDQAVA